MPRKSNAKTEIPSTNEPKKNYVTLVLSKIKDVVLKRIVGFALIILSIFLCISFFSYFYFWKFDQDQVHNTGFFAALFANGISVQNQGGAFGAFLSHHLIAKSFGVASLLFIPFFAVWGLQKLLRRRLAWILRFFFHTVLSILSLSVLFAFFFKADKHEFPFGGAFGRSVISYSKTYLQETGTWVAVIVLALLLASFYLYKISTWGIWSKLFQGESASEASNELPAGTQEESPNYVEWGATANPIQTQANQLEFTQERTVVEPEPQPQMQETVLEKPQYEYEVQEPIEENTEAQSHSIELDTTLSIKPSNTDTDFTLEVLRKEDEAPILENASVAIANDDLYDPSLDLRDYKFPTVDLLEQRATSDVSIDTQELENNKNQIISTLKSFGIAIAKISATVGPTVTLYEIVPAEGVRISKIRNLEDDIALSLAALGIRIIAPIPGKGTIGIEVPNHKKQMVGMRSLISSEKFIHNDFSLPIALGKKIDNENYIVDLAKMPHLLMAGATGQGKSVGINTILVSLLYKKHPSQLKFVMVDPKKVELSIYKLIEKHFLAKLPNEEEAIITDTKKVINTLNALCIEMDNRYDLLKEAGVRNIKEYNEKFIKRKLNPNKGHKYLPFIVLVVDEFADLIMTAGKEVEMPIARLAQLARAIGIHLIIATQRPSVNVITGTIKANFPARVAFRVSAKVDSRTILDAGGAEQLIGQGDMLIVNGSDLVRLQCAFVDTPEVERIVEFIGEQRGYPHAFNLPEYEGSDAEDFGGGGGAKSLKDVDSMFEQCARLVVTSNSGSTSMLQRRFNLGYNRAGRIMDQLEAAGIVGAGQGSKPREVMVHTEAELDEVLRAIGVL